MLFGRLRDMAEKEEKPQEDIPRAVPRPEPQAHAPERVSLSDAERKGASAIADAIAEGRLAGPEFDGYLQDPSGLGVLVRNISSVASSLSVPTPYGGKETLELEKIAPDEWEALARRTSGVQLGAPDIIPKEIGAKIAEKQEERDARPKLTGEVKQPESPSDETAVVLSAPNALEHREKINLVGGAIEAVMGAFFRQSTANDSSGKGVALLNRQQPDAAYEEAHARVKEIERYLKQQEEAAAQMERARKEAPPPTRNVVADTPPPPAKPIVENSRPSSTSTARPRPDPVDYYDYPDEPVPLRRRERSPTLHPMPSAPDIGETENSNAGLAHTDTSAGATMLERVNIIAKTNRAVQEAQQAVEAHPQAAEYDPGYLSDLVEQASGAGDGMIPDNDAIPEPLRGASLDELRETLEAARKVEEANFLRRQEEAQREIEERREARRAWEEEQTRLEIQRREEQIQRHKDIQEGSQAAKSAPGYLAEAEEARTEYLGALSRTDNAAPKAQKKAKERLEKAQAELKTSLDAAAKAGFEPGPGETASYKRALQTPDTGNLTAGDVKKVRTPVGSKFVETKPKGFMDWLDRQFHPDNAGVELVPMSSDEIDAMVRRLTPVEIFEMHERGERPEGYEYKPRDGFWSRFTGNYDLVPEGSSESRPEYPGHSPGASVAMEKSWTRTVSRSVSEDGIETTITSPTALGTAAEIAGATAQIGGVLIGGGARLAGAAVVGTGKIVVGTASVAANILVGGAIAIADGMVETAELMARAAEAWRIYRAEKKQEHEFNRAMTVHEAFERAGIHTTPEMADMLANQLFGRWDRANSIAHNLAGLADLGYSGKQIADISVLESGEHSSLGIAQEAFAFHDVGVTPEEHVGIAAINARSSGRSRITPETVRQAQDYVMRYNAPENTRAMANLGVLGQIQQIRECWHPGGNHQTLAQMNSSRVPNEDALVNDLIFLRDVLGIAVVDILRLAQAGFVAVDLQIMSDKLGLKRGDFSPSVITEITGLGREGWKVERQRMKTMVLDERHERDRAEFEGKSRALGQIDALGDAVTRGVQHIQGFLNLSQGATESGQLIAALGVLIPANTDESARDRMLNALERAQAALNVAEDMAAVKRALHDFADASGNPGVRGVVGAVDAVLDGTLDVSEVPGILEQKRDGLQRAQESLARARKPAQTEVERSERAVARSRNNLHKHPDLTQSEATAVTRVEQAGQKAGFIAVPAPMVQEYFPSRPLDPDSLAAQATADLTLMSTPRDGRSIAAVLASNGSINISFGRIMPGGVVLTLAELAGEGQAAIDAAIGRLNIIADAAERIGYGKPDAALLLGLLHYAGTLQSPEDFSLAGFAESRAGRILRVRQISLSGESFMPFDMAKFCKDLSIKPGEAKRIDSFWDLYGQHAGLSTMSLAILGVAGHGIDHFDPRIMQDSIVRGRDAIARAVHREQRDPIVAQHVADLQSYDGEMDALRVAYLSRFEPGTPMHMVAGCLMPPEVAELLLRMGTKMLIHLDKTLEAISGDSHHAGVDATRRVIAIASGAGEIAASLTALRVRAAIWLNVIPPEVDEADLASRITMDLHDSTAAGKLEALGRSASSNPEERRTIQYAMTHLARRVYGGDLSTLKLSEMGSGGAIPWPEIRAGLETILTSAAEGSQTYMGRIATALAFIDELVADAHLQPPERWAEELRDRLMPSLSGLVRGVIRPHIQDMLGEYREKGAAALHALGADAVKSEALSIGFSIPAEAQLLFPPEVVTRLEGLARRIPQGARAASSVYVQVLTASDVPTIIVVPGVDHLFHGLANDIMGGSDSSLHLWPDRNSRSYREARTDLAGWVQTQLGAMASAYHAGHVLNDAERYAELTAVATASLARFVNDPLAVVTEFYAGIGKPVPDLGIAGWVDELRDAVLPVLARGAALLGGLPAEVIPEIERTAHLAPGSLTPAAHTSYQEAPASASPSGGDIGKPRMGRRKDKPMAPDGGGKGNGGDDGKPPAPPPAEDPLGEDGAPPNKKIRVIHITAPHVMSHTGDTDHVWAITHALKAVGFRASFFNRMGMLPKEEEMENLRKQREANPTEAQILHIQLRPPVQGTYFTPDELAELGDVVITVHEYGTLSDKDRETVDAYARVADHLIFSSEADRDLAAAREPSVADKSTIIPISVTLTEEFVGKTIPTDERPPNILHWGSIHHDNGQDHAIALAKAIQQDPELMAKGVKVIIAGTPVNASAVKALLKEAYGLNDDDLKLIGRNQYWRAKELLEALKESGREPILPVEIHFGVENKDIADLFSRARIVYHSSHHGLRPNGTSVITAALHGMGIVAHEGEQTTPEMSAAARLVHSPEEALAEIKTLFDNIEAERSLREQSQAYAATRTPASAATEYEDIYRRLISRKRGQQRDIGSRDNGDDGRDDPPSPPDDDLPPLPPSDDPPGRGPNDGVPPEGSGSRDDSGEKDGEHPDPGASVPVPSNTDADAQVWSDLGIVAPRINVAGNVYIHPNGIPAIVPAPNQDPNLVFTPIQLADEPEAVAARISEALGERRIDMTEMEPQLLAGMRYTREIEIAKRVYALLEEATQEGHIHPLIHTFPNWNELEWKIYELVHATEERGTFFGGTPILDILRTAGVDDDLIGQITEIAHDVVVRSVANHLWAEMGRTYGYRTIEELGPEVTEEISRRFMDDPERYSLVSDDRVGDLFLRLELPGSLDQLVRHMQGVAGVAKEQGRDVALTQHLLDEAQQVVSGALVKVVSQMPEEYRHTASGMQVSVIPRRDYRAGIDSLGSLDHNWTSRVVQDSYNTVGMRTGGQNIFVKVRRDGAEDIDENSVLHTVAEEIWHNVELEGKFLESGYLQVALTGAYRALMRISGEARQEKVGNDPILAALVDVFLDTAQNYAGQDHLVHLGEHFAKFPAALLRTTGEVDPEKIRAALTPLIEEEGHLTSSHVETLVNVYSGQGVRRPRKSSPPQDKAKDGKAMESSLAPDLPKADVPSSADVSKNPSANDGIVWSDLGIVAPRVEVAGNVYIHPNGIPAIVPAADQNPALVFTPAQLADEPEKVLARIREVLGESRIDMGRIEESLLAGMQRIREMVVAETVYVHLNEIGRTRGEPHPLIKKFGDFSAIEQMALELMAIEEATGSFRKGTPILDILQKAGVDGPTIREIAEQIQVKVRLHAQSFLRTELERLYGHLSPETITDELLEHVVQRFLHNPVGYKITSDEKSRTLLPIFDLSGDARTLVRHLRGIVGASRGEEVASAQSRITDTQNAVETIFARVIEQMPEAYRGAVSGLRFLVIPNRDSGAGTSSFEMLPPHWPRRVLATEQPAFIQALGMAAGNREIFVIAGTKNEKRPEEEIVRIIAEESWHETDHQNGLSVTRELREALDGLCRTLVNKVGFENADVVGDDPILRAMASGFTDIIQIGIYATSSKATYFRESFAKIPATLMRDTGEVDPEKIRKALMPLIRAEGPLTAAHVETLVNVYAGRGIGKEQPPAAPREGNTNTWEEKIRKERDNKPSPGKGVERGGS